MIKLLAESGADLNSQTRFNNITALHLAIMKKRYKIVPMLIKLGNNVNAIDLSLETPLHYLCKSEIPLKHFRALFDELVVKGGADVEFQN